MGEEENYEQDARREAEEKQKESKVFKHANFSKEEDEVNE